MRVLMLSWEYPPLLVGGLGRHVDALSRELARGGHDVTVVTRGEKTDSVTETVDGVRVVRAAADPLAIDFDTESLLAWSQAAEHALLRAALPLVRAQRPDVVHAHDWLVAQSAVTLAEFTGAPLVATVHATESGRHRGHLSRPLNVAIDSVERWFVGRADVVITCSQAMRDEVRSLFAADPVRVVPNGIDPSRWQPDAASVEAARQRYAGTGPLVAFAGRLSHEKGVQTLLDALPTLRRRHPGLRLLIAGTGLHEQDLRAQVRRLRLGRCVEWLGFLPEEELAVALAAADVAVVPSLYEPFGIVALEAAATGTPVVVSSVGGLVDLIADGVATASFAPADVSGLVAAVDGVLLGGADGHGALEVVRRSYAWPAIAARTVAIYESAGSAITSCDGP